jgi:hypothetical protein
MDTQYPIFINNRDRLQPLVQLIRWLEKVGQTSIYIVDNDSSFGPLLEFYERCPYEVIRLGQNMGHLAPWESGWVGKVCPDQYYVVTDADIVPVSYCPDDALAHFRDLLDRYPERLKVGFGLKIDDLPRHYKFAAEVRAWEGQYWQHEVEPNVYDAVIDTTFALFRPGLDQVFQIFWSALRTGEPYVARHSPWYADTRRPNAEERHYRAHARPDLNHWDTEELPDRLITMMENAGVSVDRSRLPFLRRLTGRR